MEDIEEKGFVKDLAFKIAGLFRGETAPKRKALVVGFEHYGTVTTYQNTMQGAYATVEDKSLPEVTHDAHAVAGKLAKNAKGDNFAVRCVIDDADIREEDPSSDYVDSRRQEGQNWCDLVDQELDILFDGSTANDTLLFYYSGHGTYDARDKQLLFAFPHDGEIEKFEYYEMSRLMDRVEKSEFLHCVIILDCCYGGGLADLQDSPSFCKLKKGVTIITAGQEGRAVSSKSNPIQIGKTQIDWKLAVNDATDFPEYKVQKGRHGTGVQVNYSYLTGFIVEALAGGAADPMGIITTTSLYQYVSEAMWTIGNKQDIDRSRIIRPMLKCHTDEAVPLKIVSCYLNDTDLKYLYKKFKTGVIVHGAQQLVADSLAHELIVLESNVKGHTDIQRSINRLIRLQLAEGRSVTVGEKSVCFYRLTARGKHYWDMVKHIYQLDTEATKE